MAAPAVASRTWMAQTRAINRMIPSLNFLQNLLFSNHVTEDFEDIELSSYVRGRKMAPMVRRGAQAVAIVGHTTEFQVVRAPNIRIKKALSPWNTFDRYVGTNVFASGAEASSANEQRDARDLQGLRDDIGNRMEWMCAQAIRGAITYEVADQEVFTITYPRDAGNSVAATVKWDDAAPTTVRPEEDIEVAQRLIHTAEGLNITHALCGSTAATYLRRVAKANNWHLDTKGIFDAYQSVKFGAAFDVNGARPIARINGIDFYEYSTAVTDENGTSQPMIRAKYVEFVCANPAAENKLHYGAIPENVPGNLFRGELFSKSIVEEDPPATIAIAHTRPLPVLHRPNATVSMQVIT